MTIDVSQTFKFAKLGARECDIGVKLTFRYIVVATLGYPVL